MKNVFPIEKKKQHPVKERECSFTCLKMYAKIKLI